MPRTNKSAVDCTQRLFSGVCRVLLDDTVLQIQAEITMLRKNSYTFDCGYAGCVGMQLQHPPQLSIEQKLQVCEQLHGKLRQLFTPETCKIIAQHPGYIYVEMDHFTTFLVDDLVIPNCDKHVVRSIGHLLAMRWSDITEVWIECSLSRDVLNAPELLDMLYTAYLKTATIKLHQWFINLVDDT